MGKIVNPSTADDQLHAVDASTFLRNLTDKRAVNQRIREATSPAGELPTSSVTYYLTDDAKSGFGVTYDGELVALFSTHPGRGDRLVDVAISVGAARLDCFDGYLTAFYARHGFREVRREPNWTPGGPDVVWMVRP